MSLNQNNIGSSGLLYKTYLLGLGKMGLQVLKKAKGAKVNAELVSIDIQRGLFNAAKEQGVRHVILEANELIQAASVLEELFPKKEMARYIVIGGMGGRATNAFLFPLTNYLRDIGAEHFSVGVFPFSFEGEIRSQRAISAHFSEHG